MIMRQKNYFELKKLGRNLGIDLFGVADISKIKDEFAVSEKIRNKCDKAVCIGVALSSGVLEDIENAPTRLYFHHYRTLNAIIDQLSLRMAGYIQKKGYTAVPIPASQIIDWQENKAHLSHKKIGYLAGLGWIGRNNLLVNQKFGSQFRLATILTDMPLKIDKPTLHNCGGCKACVVICPAQAIKEDAADFNHIGCFEKLKEFQKQRLVDQFICGVCVNVCHGSP